MTKHKYNVYGVFQAGGSLFSGTCVSDDIVKVIEMKQAFQKEKSLE